MQKSRVIESLKRYAMSLERWIHMVSAIVCRRHVTPNWPTVSCPHTLTNITINNVLTQCLV